MLRRWLPPLLLLVVAAGSWWFLAVLDDDDPDGDEATRHVPDYYMDNFEATTMGLTGKPRRRLQAEHMAHFPDTDTHELKRPYLVVYHEERLPWHVRSEEGWVSPDGDVILLKGEVNIWREDENGKPQIRVDTRNMRVLPDTDFGETDEPVVIRTDRMETRGVGMRAFLDESRLELLSKVRTVHQPATP